MTLYRIRSVQERLQRSLPREPLVFLCSRPQQTFTYLTFFVNLVQVFFRRFFDTFSQHGQNDVQEEVGAADDNGDAEDGGDARLPGVLEVVHEVHPAFERDHLKYYDEAKENVVKRSHPVVN